MVIHSYFPIASPLKIYVMIWRHRFPIYIGTFNDLDHHQVAALASCFIPGDKSNEQIQLRTELGRPLQQLQDSARKIAEVFYCWTFDIFCVRAHYMIIVVALLLQVQHECKLDINVEEYVESTVRPYLMDVIYSWSKVSFASIVDWCSSTLFVWFFQDHVAILIFGAVSAVVCLYPMAFIANWHKSP